jgi:hypothetical protein
MTVKAESSEKKETIVGTFATPQRKKVHTPPPPNKKNKKWGGKLDSLQPMHFFTAVPSKSGNKSFKGTSLHQTSCKENHVTPVSNPI